MNDETDDIAEAKSKGPGAMIMVPATMVGTLAVVAAAFFLLGGPAKLQGASASELSAEDTHSEDYGEKAKDEHKSPSSSEPKKVLELEPFVVSLRNDTGRSRGPRLRFVVVIEGLDAKTEEADVFLLRNEILLAVQEVEVGTLRGPEGIDALRAAIEVRTTDKLDMPIYSILITDYIML